MKSNNIIKTKAIEIVRLHMLYTWTEDDFITAKNKAIEEYIEKLNESGMFCSEPIKEIIDCIDKLTLKDIAD